MRKAVFGLIGAMLVIGFVFSGCDNGTTESTTKFEGTWKHQMNELNAVYVFSGNNWRFSSAGQMNVSPGPFSGTFTFDDTSITFTATSGGSGTWTQPYTLSTGINNTEVLNLDSNTSGTMITELIGPFAKQ
jgi:hypothetical protein